MKTAVKASMFEDSDDEDDLFGTAKPKPKPKEKTPEIVKEKTPTPEPVKFGHLNFDPTKMRVGRAPSKRKREKQEMDQSVLLNKATVKKKGRRKRTKKKIKIDDDSEEKTQVSASLFSAVVTVEEKEDLPSTPKQTSKAIKKSMFADLDSEDDIDAMLVRKRNLTTGDWQIGFRESKPIKTRFDGSIQNLRVFNYSLSEDEIASVYAADLSECAFEKNAEIMYLSEVQPNLRLWRQILFEVQCARASQVSVTV